jgi:hypothetical protein
MATVLSHLASFALGLLSGYVLIVLQDRRRARQALSKEAYRPLHKQIHRALQQFETSQRALAIKPNFWRDLEAAGMTQGIKSSIQAELKGLYTRIFPDYDSAWLEACLRAVPALLRKWDQEYGVARGQLKIREVNWWQVATDEDFLPDLLPLQDCEALCLHDMVFPAWQPMPLESFIRQRKRELEELPAIRQFKARRTEAINRSSDILKALVKKVVF